MNEEIAMLTKGRLSLSEGEGKDFSKTPAKVQPSPSSSALFKAAKVGKG
jgi:hypothetical protein